MVGFRRIEQQERVARGSRIQDDKTLLSSSDGFRERSKDGDFFRAGRAQILFEQRLALPVECGADFAMISWV